MFAPIIGNVLINTNKAIKSNDPNSIEEYASKDIEYFQTFDTARVLATINGSDVLSVVKNSEGNNLPLFSQVSLIYRTRKMHDNIRENRYAKQDAEKGLYYETPYDANDVFNNIENIKDPDIRTEVNGVHGVTSSSKLSAADLTHCEIVYDFFANLVSKNADNDNERANVGLVSLQNHCFSDKVRQFLTKINLNSAWTLSSADGTIVVNPHKLITDYIASGDESIIKPILDAWYFSNKKQYRSIVNNIINDYRIVFPEKTINTISDIESILKDKSINVRSEFKNKGIEFVEEYHASKVNGKPAFNETLEYFYDIFDCANTEGNNMDKFNEFVNNLFNRFVEKLGVKNALKDNYLYRNIGNDAFLDKDKKVVKAFDGDRKNPVLFSYFLTNDFLLNDYNKVLFGEVFAHPQKIKEGKNNDGFNTHALAARWTAQVKRMVIAGATYHSYYQNMKYGVKSKIKYAVMSDIGSNVFNLSGDNTRIDSQDGAGWTHPILSRQQNVSLVDAPVGADKKTIMHDVDAKFGRPTTLKWAEFELTNAVRRNVGSDVNPELLYKRMSSLKFDNSISLSLGVKELGDLYFRGADGNNYKILSIFINNGTAYRNIVRVDENGEVIGDIQNENFGEVNTLYGIDQLLGGAWCKEYDEDLNKLKYSEKNLDILHKVVGDLDLGDYMIGWLVNKSAIKVGASNVNNESDWYSEDDLWYSEMSSKFGGVQMNSDHELDEADTNEATQMVSALEQNGYTHNIAMEVYREIGKFAAESISEITDLAYSGDKDKLYEIFGKAVVKAFQTGNKDTLGLAQSFIKLAQKGFNEKKIDYKIPFSSPSINGIFNSTVTTELVKRAIRRRYSGVGAVQHPAYGIIQYYNINERTMKYDRLVDYIKQQGVVSDVFKDVNPIEFIKNKIIIVNGKPYYNPFIEIVNDYHDVDFEDTIVLEREQYEIDGKYKYENANREVIWLDNEGVDSYINENGEEAKLTKVYVDENGNETYEKLGEVVKIDSYFKYDKFRNGYKGRIYKWTIKPKNLKGSDTVRVSLRQHDDGTQYIYKESIFDSNESRILHYFDLFIKDKNIQWSDLSKSIQEYERNNNISEWSIVGLFYNLFNKPLNDDIIDTTNAKKTVDKKLQDKLNEWSAEKDNIVEFEGLSYKQVEVIPAQIIMGKLFAKQLGLLHGDSVSEIKERGPEFFKNRIEKCYTNDNNDRHLYDRVFYDGTGKKLYIKTVKSFDEAPDYGTIFESEEYKVIDGVVYYNGEELCSAEGKQFFTKGEYEYCIVLDDDEHSRVNEIWNSRMYTWKEGNSPTHPKAFNDWLDKTAQMRYDSFLNSLKFIGTRIPCQSMQSFDALEVIEFTDSEVNDVYIPTRISWVAGSDFDIDKIYLQGFSLSNNGTLAIDENAPKWMKDEVLRNHVTNKIFDVILDPSNQINITKPISTDRIQKLAQESILGLAGKSMNQFDPASKFEMQVENSVGKDCIGNVATAIKSYFAISNVYNEKFNEIYEFLRDGEYDLVRNLLSQYTFTRNGKIITLANVNVNKFKKLRSTEL